jgi:hypothetical protein
LKYYDQTYDKAFPEYTKMPYPEMKGMGRNATKQDSWFVTVELLLASKVRAPYKTDLSRLLALPVNNKLELK